MIDSKDTKYFKRPVSIKKTFDVPGTFESLWAAEKWLNDHGYSYGSLCRNYPVAITKGKYFLPEKWMNFKDKDKKFIDGVMTSLDFREGSVTIYIYE